MATDEVVRATGVLMNSMRHTILLAALLCSSVGICAEPVRIAIGEWPPYLSKELKHYGVAAHIVTEAFAREGLKVEYTFLPWKRAENYVSSGEQECSIMWVKNDKRGEQFLFSDVVFEGEVVFFHLKSFKFDWQSYHDLAGLRIGGLLSGVYPWVEQAKKEGIDLDVNPVVNEVQNFKKLLYKRIDVYGMDRLIGYDLLRTNFSAAELQKVAHHVRSVEQWPYRLIFSKQVERSAYLVAAFNRGLQKLKHERVVQRYMQASEAGRYKKTPPEK